MFLVCAALGPVGERPVVPVREWGGRGGGSGGAGAGSCITVPMVPVQTSPDAEGNISQTLTANTDPDTEPPDSGYWVVEEFLGGPTRTFRIVIPHDQGSPLNLYNLSSSATDPFSDTFPVTF